MMGLFTTPKRRPWLTAIFVALLAVGLAMTLV